MEAYFYNTESKKRYTIKYIDTRINDGSVSVSYQAANVPQSKDNNLFWIKTEKTAKSVTLYLDGEKIQEDVNTLRGFCYPEKDKKAPSIITFKIADLPAVDVVFTSVNTDFDLNFLTNNKVTRCQVVIQFMEISKN